MDETLRQKIERLADECDQRLASSTDRVLQFWNNRLRALLAEHRDERPTPEPPSDVTAIINDALTDALHPEFGTEWREPDGIIYKAVTQEHYLTLKYAADLVATFQTVEEAAAALRFIGEKGLENV